VAPVQCMFSADPAEVFACWRLCVSTCISLFVCMCVRKRMSNACFYRFTFTRVLDAFEKLQKLVVLSLLPVRQREQHGSQFMDFREIL